MVEAGRVKFEHPEVEGLDGTEMEALQDRKLRAMGEGGGSGLGRALRGLRHEARAAEPRKRSKASARSKRRRCVNAIRFRFSHLRCPRSRVSARRPVQRGFPSCSAIRSKMVGGLSCRIRWRGSSRVQQRYVRGERVYQRLRLRSLMSGASWPWLGFQQATDARTSASGRDVAEAVVQWLRDHEYTVCTMSPALAHDVGRPGKAAGIDPKRNWRVRLGLFGGQSVPPPFATNWKRRCPTVSSPQNIYGSTESGGPDQRHCVPMVDQFDQLHLINDDYDPHGDSRSEAWSRWVRRDGRNRLPAMDREASPVVRWRTRDLVRLADGPEPVRLRPARAASDRAESSATATTC